MNLSSIRHQIVINISCLVYIRLLLESCAIALVDEHVNGSLPVALPAHSWTTKLFPGTDNESIDISTPHKLNAWTLSGLQMLGVLGYDESLETLCASLHELNAAMWEENQLFLVAKSHYWLINFKDNALYGPFRTQSRWRFSPRHIEAACKLDELDVIFANKHYYLYKSYDKSLLSSGSIANWPLFDLLQPTTLSNTRIGCAMCRAENRSRVEISLISLYYPLTITYSILIANNKLQLLQFSVSEREYIIEQVKVGPCHSGEVLPDQRLLWVTSKSISISKRYLPAPMQLNDYFNCDTDQMHVMALVSFYLLCTCTLLTIVFLVFNFVWHPLSRSSFRVPVNKQVFQKNQ